MTALSTRQIHLDFHTSEHIPDIGADFNAADFAKTVRESHVNSMTVFAKCHHGWLYYPSKVHPELIHPHLARPNLLLEQVDALHEAGVRAPVYVTVQWDYHSATTRPEWLIRAADGSHEGAPFSQPGFYQSLCVNTGYNQLIRDHVAELCELLGDKLDGFFFDIVGIRPCYCAACRAEMKRTGVDHGDPVAVQHFAKHVIDRFKHELSAFVRSHNPNATIFYNAGHVGPCTRASMDAYSHFELESLPSGSWGYLHFPVTARYARTLGMDCMGMTGKFHTEWGDFHSLKNQAALEFECFRMLSYGFACSVGDQLEPRGELGAATYRLIGNVYGQVAEREAWARPSVPMVEAALVTGEDKWKEFMIPESVMGAVQMLEELGLQFDIVDTGAELSHYKLLILPDDFICNSAFQQRIDEFVSLGGAVIACNEGGLCEGAFPSCYGVNYRGTRSKFPDFIIADGPLAQGLEHNNEYAIYMQGADFALDGAQAALSARAPYFPREGDRFCSHRYTPSAKGEAYPSATQNGRVLYFAHPLFSQYRDCAPRWCKTLIENALGMLLPERLVRHNGPSTLSVQLLHQPEHRRYTLHVLSYVPVRKSAKIDIIEERTVLHDVAFELTTPEQVTSARLVPDGTALTVSAGCVTVPVIDGYAILELNY